MLNNAKEVIINIIIPNNINIMIVNKSAIMNYIVLSGLNIVLMNPFDVFLCR